MCGAGGRRLQRGVPFGPHAGPKGTKRPVIDALGPHAGPKGTLMPPEGGGRPAVQENRRNAAPNGADGKAGAARRSRGGKRRTEDGGRPKGDGEAMRGKPFPRPPPGVQGGRMFDPGAAYLINGGEADRGGLGDSSPNNNRAPKGHKNSFAVAKLFLVPQAGVEPARL